MIPARFSETLERGNHRRMTAPHMDQRGQVEIHRQLQLRVEQRLLAFTVRVSMK